MLCSVSSQYFEIRRWTMDSLAHRTSFMKHNTDYTKGKPWEWGWKWGYHFQYAFYFGSISTALSSLTYEEWEESTRAPIDPGGVCRCFYSRAVSVRDRLVDILTYYTTSSASGQDEPNLALWLATRAGKMELSCPLGVRVIFIMLWCFIPYPLLTKLVRSKWLDIGLVLFLRVYGPRLRLSP